jgi:hypothetical protein
MSTGLKIVLGFLGFVTLVGIIMTFSVIGTYNECIKLENVIRAQYTANQSNYDSMWKKVKESAQVNAMYTDDLKKVYDSAIQGRYGKDGSKAVFQFIKEHNPNFDSSLYRQVQATIESGRNTFDANQKMLTDKKQIYETYIGSFPNNIVAGSFGFPRIDLTKFDIVTSDSTQKAFETKKADEIKIK